jgi:hypothetical protein
MTQNLKSWHLKTCLIVIQSLWLWPLLKICRFKLTNEIILLAFILKSIAEASGMALETSLILAVFAKWGDRRMIQGEAFRYNLNFALSYPAFIV